MRKLLVTLLVLCVLTLAACNTATQTTEPAAPEPAPAQPTTGTTQIPTLPTPANTAEVQTLLEKHKTASSYQYSYDKNQPNRISKVYVRGEKIRKEYGAPRVRFDPDTYISDVYLDRTAKTAIGVCLPVDYCSETHRNVGVTSSFASENIETPRDLAASITTAQKVDKVLYENREAIRLRITKNGKPAMVWIDNYSGLALRIEYYNAQGDVIEYHTYTDLAEETVTESDVTLPTTVKVQ